MAQEIAIPESVASDLAVTASKCVSDQLEKNYTTNAERLADASEKLIRASQNEDNGRFVSVSEEVVSSAAAFCEYDVEAGQNARAFLKNQGYW